MGSPAPKPAPPEAGATSGTPEPALALELAAVELELGALTQVSAVALTPAIIIATSSESAPLRSPIGILQIAVAS